MSAMRLERKAYFAAHSRALIKLLLHWICNLNKKVNCSEKRRFFQMQLTLIV